MRIRRTIRLVGYAALLLGLCVPASAQDCLSYADYLYLHALPDPDAEGGVVSTLAIEGGHAFVSTVGRGILAHGLSDPRRSTYFGRIGGNGGDHAVSLAGHGLLCVAGDEGLRIYDVADPSNEQLLLYHAHETDIADLAWLGDRLVVLDGDGTLRVAALGDPSAPVWTHEGRVAEFAWAMAAAETVVYVAGSGLALDGGPSWIGVGAVPVGPAGQPLEVGGQVLDVELPPMALAVADGHLWGVGWDFHGFVLDDPLTPTRIAVLPQPGSDIVARNGALFVAAGHDGLRVLDVSDPATPVETMAFTPPAPVTRVAADGDLVLMGTSGHGSYTLAGTNVVPVPVRDEPTTFADYVFMAPWEDKLLALTAAGRFEVLELIDDQFLVPVSATWLYCEEVIGMIPLAEHCFIITRDQLLYTIDLRDPQVPAWRQQEVGCCEYINAAVLDGTLLALCKESGTALWDVSDPDAPESVGVVTGLDYEDHSAMAIDGSHAVVVLKEGFYPALVLLDLTDPALPVVRHELVLSYLETPPTDLQIDGDLLHVVCFEEIETYTGVRSGFLELEAELPLHHDAAGLRRLGNRGFLEGGEAVTVLDFDVPEQPVVLSVIECGRNLQVLQTGIGPLALRYDGSVARLYAACDLILPVEPGAPPPAPLRPDRTALSSAAPNPFNPSLRIGFALAEPGRTRVTVHDLMGRRIATLVDRPFAAGAHAVDWHGRDDAGRACASGGYVVRLVQGDRVDSRKVMLAR